MSLRPVIAGAVDAGRAEVSISARRVTVHVRHITLFMIIGLEANHEHSRKFRSVYHLLSNLILCTVLLFFHDDELSNLTQMDKVIYVSSLAKRLS